jgi:hypothetical protein
MPLDMNRDEILRKYGDLVTYMLKKYSNHEFNKKTGVIDREDVKSAGYIGLFGAARDYDPSRGVPFFNFAYMRVRGLMRNELRRGVASGSEKESLGKRGNKCSSEGVWAVKCNREKNQLDALIEKDCWESSKRFLSKGDWQPVEDAIAKGWFFRNRTGVKILRKWMKRDEQ